MCRKSVSGALKIRTVVKICVKNARNKDEKPA